MVVQYEPPEGLTPAEAGTLIDNSADMRDITATMIDLAVRGFIKIEERKEEKLFGLIKNDEYVLHRLKTGSEEHALAVHERRVLDGIFDFMSLLDDLCHPLLANGRRCSGVAHDIAWRARGRET